MSAGPPDQPVITQYSPRSLLDGKTQYARAHQVIKNYMLEFCQLLFNGENYPLKWDANQDKTQINIVDKYSFNLTMVTANPCIVANRGPMLWTKQSGINRLQHEDFKTGKKYYTDLIRGAVTLSCFSQQGLEAEDIAGFLWESLQSFRNVLRKLTNGGRIISGGVGLFKVETTTLGEEALVKSDSRPELSVVPVAVAAMAQRRWSTEPAARQLQQVNTRTSRGT